VTPINRPPRTWNLSAFYTQHISARGVPIVGSSQVAPAALYEAFYLINALLFRRPDIRRVIIQSRVRCAVMAAAELTTQIPEHADLIPASVWDRRARGLGATPTRPAVSCGEENLLHYPGDPYVGESILIHEFAHVIHLFGLRTLDSDFDRRLHRSYRRAIRQGLWRGTYAGSCPEEYWAEGVQSWFDANQPADPSHNGINTRERLEDYDPTLADLIAGVFRSRTWRYRPPCERPAESCWEMPTSPPTFTWPDRLEDWWRDHLDMSTSPPRVRKRRQRKTERPI